MLESKARDKKVNIIDGYEIHEVKGMLIGYQYMKDSTSSHIMVNSPITF